MFDYHVHTDFSADCDIPMEEMIENAKKRGIQEICFTEHIDYDYPDPTISFLLDLDNYDQTIKRFQEKYKNKITIKKGVELGVQPHVLEDYNQIVNQEFFDFIICSMHTTDKIDLHSGRFFEEKSLNEAYEQYYGELLSCIKSFNQYSILGHLDLVKRYKYEPDVYHFLDYIEEIFKVVIHEGKGIEVNNSGFKYGLGSAMPSEDILQLYKDMNGEIITIGSDSHSPSTLGTHYEETIELLKKTGFKYVATFEQQKPVFHKI
ncbi:histidinol-phosphatase HisJ family protein [Salinibacillus xinjiangensis]|uniref:Histidinol-phosphatase n=1 Tax=Salinibacillus xinjiangensis TaxID=1229268 RepID=A0A6G1X8G1_9BACI|nr:histidinol-phosphatase HisJ family protein [Salinibacillus xinjiangensis]MRG87254.1 histidinol-phosphatase HisJ family protein [Salinibacillus xinjiangensis]